MKLVASMVVHNELGRYLDLAIEHLLTYVDEVRVLDDYSTDGSGDFLRDQDRVAVLPNDGPPMFEHESVARNRLLQWTYEAEPDFVLAIDADEFVGRPDLIRHAIDSATIARRPVHSLTMAEVWNADAETLGLRWDGFWKRRTCPVLFFVPPKRSSELWFIPARDLACGREPRAVRSARAKATGSDILHFGWTRRAERDDRYARYVKHDDGRFHNDRHLLSIMWPDEKVRLVVESWPTGLESMRERLVARANR